MSEEIVRSAFGFIARLSYHISLGCQIPGKDLGSKWRKILSWPGQCRCVGKFEKYNWTVISKCRDWKPSSFKRVFHFTCAQRCTPPLFLTIESVFAMDLLQFCPLTAVTNLIDDSFFSNTFKCFHQLKATFCAYDGIKYQWCQWHRKNCECCPVSLLIVRHQRLSWIQVLNWQNCNKCLKCHKCLGLSLLLSL